MCHTCGHHDYFDDLKYELEDLGIKTETKKMREAKDGTLVDYNIIS